MANPGLIIGARVVGVDLTATGKLEIFVEDAVVKTYEETSVIKMRRSVWVFGHPTQTALRHQLLVNVRNQIETCVVRNLVSMGHMGMEFVELIRARHPEFPFRPELGSHGDPWEHLPPLSNQLRALVRRVRRAA
jgi:hypothetical protein